MIEDHVLPGHEGATNNEIELLACIRALQMATDHHNLHAFERGVIFTDSLYVSDNVDRAKFQWSREKWLNREGRPIENATVWKDLVHGIKKFSRRVDVEWVKGHSKDVHNKAVAKLAKLSAKGVLTRWLEVATVRRKRPTQTVQIGSVLMRGPTLAIRIITDTYLKPQKLFKYKYEVLAGEFSSRVDLIFADEVLRAGHHYEVRVNEQTENPRIVEVIQELER